MAHLPRALRSLALAAAATLWPGTPAFSQAIPPAIRALFEKQRAGQELTEAEEARLAAWEAEMEKRFEAMEKAHPNGPEAPNTSQSRSAGPRAVPGLPAAAPSREAYLRLVKEVRGIYGTRAGASRRAIDQQLAAVKTPTAGADLGGVLVLAGGGSAAVYATSGAALQAPGDYLAANNLGWILCGMDDPARGVAILRYAAALRPRDPLALLNLGWAYHHAGHPAEARRFFEQALKAAPEDPAPHLGLGLLAQREQRWQEMVEHLWQALVKRHSSAGARAFSLGREQAAGSRPGPLAETRGDEGGLSLPESPLLAQGEDMASQGPVLREALAEVDARLQALGERRGSLTEAYRQRNAALANERGSGQLRRSFEREMFLLSDIARMTLGDGGPVGRAMKEAQGTYARLTEANQRAAGEAVQDGDTTRRLGEELIAAIQANSDPEIQRVRQRMDEHAYRVCRKAKAQMEENLHLHHQAWSRSWEAFRAGARDYVGFSGPVLARIHDPLLNELQNNWRERILLQTLRAHLQGAQSLAGMAEGYRKLKCVPPKPPPPPRKPSRAKVAPKAPECPFERPLVLPLVVGSIELDCTKAKVEVGEGLLISLQRDFKNKETTVGLGVGYDTHNPLIGGSMKMMLEMTVDRAGEVKDLSLAESGSATGLGIQFEGTVRVSLTGGPEAAGYSGEGKWDATGLVP